MAGKKKINYDKYSAGLFTRTEQYADKVRQHFADAVGELLKLTATGDLGASGAFSFGDSTKLSEQSNAILRGLYASVYQEIKGGVQSEWEYANLSCDALIESIFGKGLKEDNHFARWFSRNQDAMDSFFKRKSAYGGLNLSQKVWRYVGNLKTEMEVALSVSLGQGDSAATVSRKVREYLQEPDKMFRRFRVKTGEKDILDADGNVIGKEPIYGRRWKRKVIDPQTGAVTWENFNPRNYNPGQGVYRSSYKNAMRLTRTETNMAYRAADQDRWKRMDFVVGYRVCLSNNHPAPDICNDLSAPRDDRKSDRGVYPKDFVFKGWHPQCRCYVIPILASDDEFVAMEQAKLQGKQPPIPKGIIRKPNKAFFDWLEANKERMETATKMPYWMQDNQDYITGKKGQKRVKTDAEREAIRKAWAERAIKNQKIIKMATNVANVAQNYPEIDLTKLQEYINAKNVSLANTEARAIAKQVAAIKQDEKALSVLIPDVHTWKQQFTSTELHGVYDAVEKKLAGWSGLSLEKQKDKLAFEIKYVANPSAYKAGAVQHKTWQVAEAAYTKKQAEVIDAIDWQDIDKVLQEAKTFKTKSQPYLDLISQLETAISTKNKTDAQNIVADMQAKRQALAKAAAARSKKKGAKPITFAEECFTDDRKNAAAWNLTAQDADDYFHQNAVEFFAKLTDAEKEALWGYTGGSGYITETLRAIPGHWYYYNSQYARIQRDIDAMTSAMQKQELKKDAWIKRDSDPWNINYIFNVDLDKFKRKPSALVGKTGIEDSFQSCGSCRETRFTCTGPKKVIMNIYCPKGTKAAYAQPWSSCGTYKRGWDGKRKSNPSRYDENEVILQRGAKMRITKAEYKGGMWYIDVDVLGFDVRDFDLINDAAGVYCKFK